MAPLELQDSWPSPPWPCCQGRDTCPHTRAQPPAYAIQVWEHSPGRWITVETETSQDAALSVGVRLAPIEPDVRVTEHGISIARWLMGARTVA